MKVKIIPIQFVSPRADPGGMGMICATIYEAIPVEQELQRKLSPSPASPAFTHFASSGLSSSRADFRSSSASTLVWTGESVLARGSGTIPW